jgi:hypothetical protein
MAGTSAWGQISQTAGNQEVPAVRLDDLCAAYSFTDASVVKIDVEGAELSVLEGGESFFRGNPTLRIVFESNPWASLNFGYGHQTLLKKFEDYGFSLYLICGNSLIPRTSADFQESVCVDYLAVKDPRLAAVPGFEVRSLQMCERIQMTLEGLRAQEAELRAFVAATAGSMPPEMRADPGIRAALAAADGDTSPAYVSARERFRAVYKS